MKKNPLVIFILFGVLGFTSAQKQNDIWFFGDKAGLDFNFTPPKAITSDLFTLEGTASISDPAGHLLFYTNGATLWDRNQNVMPNGGGLMGGESSTQAALILPLPGSCDKYYVFTSEDQFTNGGIAYSVVDMCLNEGFGDVVLSTKNTLVIDKTTEKLTAVLHTNGVDIWIITHTHSSNKFQAFLLTSAGLNTTPVTSTTGANYTSDAIIGPVKASHDGTKIVSSATFHNICEIFDFDASTGILSNPVNLNAHWSEDRWVYGIEFSPNDDLLYLSTTYSKCYLYQLDLNTDVLTTLNSVTGNYIYGALQMGPDKKIYMVRNLSPFMDVILQPDVSGPGCQYTEHSIDLVPGTVGRLGLPNFAPYSFFQDSISALSLGNDTTICAGDSIVLSVLAGKTCPSTYVWNDGTTEPVKIIKTSGLYWVSVESSCAAYIDSIQIDVIPSAVTSINKEICAGEIFEGYSAPGIYIDTFATIAGCDSVRTLNLSVTNCPPDNCNEAFGPVYGSTVNDFAYSLAPTPAKDGFYVSGHKEDSALIVKMNLSGKIIWSRTFDIVHGQVAHVGTVIVDTQGNLVMAGNIGDDDPIGSIFACRYNPNTNQMLWTKQFITNKTNERFFTLIEKPGGGNYILSCNPQDVPANINNAQLLELDRNTGNINPSFSKRYDLGTAETLLELVYSGDYIYGVGRYSDGSQPAQMRNALVKIDPVTGHHVWAKLGHFSKNVIARFYGFDLVIEGNSIYSGYWGDPSGTSTFLNTKLFLQKTSLDGSLTWLKQYELPGNSDFAYEIIKSGNGIVVLAEKREAPQEMILFKIDFDGALLWAKSYSFPDITDPDTYYFGSNQLIELGNQLVFAGFGNSTNNQSEMLVVRTDLNGEINNPCVISKGINISVNPINNPTFYSVDIEESDAIHDVRTFSTQTFKSNITPKEECILSDTLISSINALICEGELYEGYSQSGIYTDTFITSAGCDSIRILNLTVIPSLRTSAEKDICTGGSFEGYTQSGIYVDTFNLTNGCDSIRTLHLNVIDCAPIVQYDLEACAAFMFNGSNMDYSEFLPSFPSSLSCADVSADYLFRSPPQMNKHSCTPGVNGSIAMCVSSLNSCTYFAGHQASIVIEFTVHPQADSLVKFTGIEFYEQAPLNYNWISGDSGPNNFPTFYGIRILKNGTEVFRKENIHTANSWTLQSYNFIDNDLFRVQSNTTFRIELLPYCPIGDASAVSAWDIDAVKIYAGCIAIQTPKPAISGHVITRSGQSVSKATVVMSEDADFSTISNKPTDASGHYSFEDLEKEGHYFLKGYKNDDVLNGVSTLDLIRIQKHLLGLEPFSSLHQYIAADVNHSGRVNVLDLLDLRKLLLGLYTAFPGNTSWRFGDMAQEMGGSDISLFRELKTIENLRHDIRDADFLGIKIGDVNEDIKLFTSNVTSRSEKTLTLIMENTEIKERTPFTVAMKAGEQTSLAGLQMELQLEDLELVGISSEKLSITPDNYSVHNGVLSISWSQPESILLADEDELFEIKLVAHHAGQLKDKVILAKERLRPEAYPGNDVESYAIHLEYGKQIRNQQEISFFQLEPNPFHSAFTTRFYLVNGGNTTIRFFDVSGKLLYTTEHEYSSGEHAEQISSEDIPLNNGIIYCQLICNGYTVMGRILKL